MVLSMPSMPIIGKIIDYWMWCLLLKTHPYLTEESVLLPKPAECISAIAEDLVAINNPVSSSFFNCAVLAIEAVSQNDKRCFETWEIYALLCPPSAMVTRPGLFVLSQP